MKYQKVDSHNKTVNEVRLRVVRSALSVKSFPPGYQTAQSISRRRNSVVIDREEQGELVYLWKIAVQGEEKVNASRSLEHAPISNTLPIFNFNANVLEKKSDRYILIYTYINSYLYLFQYSIFMEGTGKFILPFCIVPLT